MNLCQFYCQIRIIYLMFEQSREQEVFIKIKIKQKQEHVQMKIILNQYEEVYIPDLAKKVKDFIDFDDTTALFYFDSTKNIYVNLHQQQFLYIPLSVLVSQNFISLKLESKMSDELLANPMLKTESNRSKRSPQRHICQVFEIVQTWRSLYKRGSYNQKGERQKVTLQKAALITGVPRKSLQDYYLLLRNGFILGFDFKQNSRKKVGVLRNFVKQRKKTKIQQEPIMEKQKQKQKENNVKCEQKQDEIVLTEIRKQVFGMNEKQYQQELFRVVSNVSSDEDQIEGRSLEN